jgi:hypothetical protein
MVRYWLLSTILWYLSCLNTIVFGQSDSLLPVVFYIGEHEKLYEKMIGETPVSLYSVHDNNPEATMKYWNEWFKSFEDYAESKNKSVYGIKVWINVFWKEDGHINHIAFYPKPDSAHRNYDEFKVLLKDFIQKSHYPRISFSQSFCHFGSIQFPVYGISVKPKE